MAMKLALIGDLHLDDRSPRYHHTLEVLDWTIADALEAGARCFAFLGDLCEGRPSPRVIAALAKRFLTIREDGGDVLIVEGNHEEYEMGLIPEWLQGVRRVAWNDFQTIHDEASILLIPYPRRGRPPFHDLEDDGTIAGSMTAAAARIAEEIREELEATREVAPGTPLIVLGHFTIEGMTTRDAEFEMHGAQEVVVPRAAFEGVALAAVGHIHSQQDSNAAAISWWHGVAGGHPMTGDLVGVGGLIRHSFAEADDPKSYTLVTVNEGRVSWARRAVPAREMVVVTLPWDHTPTETIEGLRDVAGKEVKLTVEIPETSLATFDPRVFDLIREAAAYFVLDKQVIATERTRAPEIASAATLWQQFSAWQDAVGGIFEDEAHEHRLREKIAEVENT